MDCVPQPAFLSSLGHRSTAEKDLCKWIKTDTKTHTNVFFKKPQIRNHLLLLVWQGSSVGESAGFITQRAGVQISLLLPVVARDLGFEAFGERADVSVYVSVLSISVKHFIKNSRRSLC